MVIQARNWFCLGVKSLRAAKQIPALKAKKKAMAWKSGWFYIGNILHTIQDSYSEAHTLRVPPANYLANGLDNYADMCTVPVLAGFPVSRFLGMDFTDYDKHRVADNKKPKDKFRDCAREASLQVVKIFQKAFDKAIIDDALIDAAFAKARVTELKNMLLTNVWAIVDGADGHPAGGSTGAQGTVDIPLPDDALVSDAELEDYIQRQIRDQVDRKPYKKLKPEQKVFLSQYKYAARSDDRRQDADAGKYYFQFNQALDDDAFLSCGDIIPEFVNNQAIEDFEIIFEMPDVVEEENNLSDEELDQNVLDIANQGNAQELFFYDEFGVPDVLDDDNENIDDLYVISDQVPFLSKNDEIQD